MSLHRFLVLLVCCAWLSSCTAGTADTKEIESGVISPHNDLFACTNKWRGILDEWKKNGGGVKASLVETRAQIAGDETSEFSAIVKASWATQESQGKRRELSELGKWPVSEQAMREATDLYFNESKNIRGNLTGCRSLADLQPQLWNEVRSGLRKPVEAPDELDWEMPSSQWWTVYWLFVNTRQ